MNKIKKGILGLLIGIGIIIPGVSGAAILIMFGYYDKIINAISNINKEFKKSIVFLFPFFIYSIIGIILGFFVIKKLLAIIPFSISLLFSGLLLGSILSIKNDKIIFDFKNNLLLTLGFIIPSFLGLIFLNTNIKIDIYSYSIINLIIYYIIGIAISITQFIPGTSATALLMSIGIFNELLETISINYWKNNCEIFITYLAILLGFIFGVIVISKVLNKIINKYQNRINYLFMGLTFSSIFSIIFNKENLLIYQSWKNNMNYFDLVLGVILFIFGLFISILIYFINKRHNKIVKE